MMLIDVKRDASVHDLEGGSAGSGGLVRCISKCDLLSVPIKNLRKNQEQRVELPLAEDVKDCGIWSDKDLKQPSCEKPITTYDEPPVTPNVKNKILLSKGLDNNKVFKKKLNSNDDNSSCHNISSTDYNHESDENESLVHEPVQVAKKNFIFNINLRKHDELYQEAKSEILKTQNSEFETCETIDYPFDDSLTTVTANTSTSCNPISLTTASYQIMNPHISLFVKSQLSGNQTVISHRMFHNFVNDHAKLPFLQIDYSNSLPDYYNPPLPGNFKLTELYN